MLTSRIKSKNQILIHKPMNTLFLTEKLKLCNGKKESILNKWCWHNWMSTCRRMKIHSYLFPCTKLKAKYIKDFNINLSTVTLTEEKVGGHQYTGTEDHFLNITLVAQTLRATINKWNLLKLRSFCKAKDIVNKTK